MKLSTALESKWAPVLALLLSLAALAAHPEVLNLMPEKWAFLGSALGIVAQGFTKALQMPSR